MARDSEPDTFTEQLLMLQAIQYTPYTNIEAMKRDIHTYLEFRFPKDTFKYELEAAKALSWQQYESTDEFLKDFLQREIIEDVWFTLESKEFDFSRFKRDKEYLFKIGVLFRDPWQTKMTIAELIAENVPYKLKGIIEDWYWNRVEELYLIEDIK